MLNKTNDKKCNNALHARFKPPMPPSEKIKMYKNYKMRMFTIDKITYVICPDCKNFEKI